MNATQTAVLVTFPQNPNFLYDVILCLTQAKSTERWIILN